MPVKILYSPAYGAGWITWASTTPAGRKLMLRYEPFIREIEEHGSIRETQKSQLWKDFIKSWEEAGLGEPPGKGGLKNLQTYTVEEGQMFLIEEHDGFETVLEKGEGYCFLE